MSNLFVETFQRVSAANSPYPYQMRVYEALQNNKHVLINAPTGCGKSLAAIVPFLAQLNSKERFADKLIYALPLRSLASALYAETKAILARFQYENDIKITLQMGGLSEDERDDFFEGDIVFTTIDQALSGFLGIPLMLPNKLAFINSGAFIGAMFVVDEIHLLEAEKAFTTLSVMSSLLNGLSRFVLMSATITPAMEGFLNSYGAGFVHVEPTKEELSAMPPSTRKKTLHLVDELSADVILKRHRGKSIVVANTVERAQQLYDELKQNKSSECELLLLHSRFLSEDRQAKEQRILELFGKNSAPADAILVATQVIEAGIDISAHDLFTESAPANSLIQRIGRCARYPNEEGRVFVAKALDNTLPYSSELVYNTWNILKELDGKNLAVAEEKEIVERVHDEEDAKRLLPQLYSTVREKVNFCIRYGSKADAKELIRDIQSVGIAITPTPEELKINAIANIFKLPLSIARRWCKQINDVKIWTYGDDVADDGSFVWKELNDIYEIASGALLAIHPRYVSYTPEKGIFLVNQDDTENSAPVVITTNSAPRVRKFYEYKAETYSQHVRNCLVEFESLASKHLAGFAALKQKYGNLPYIEILKRAVMFHDWGKRSKEWQAVAHKWQDENYPGWRDRAEIQPEEDGKIYLAHTDSKANNQSKRPRFPEHAALGAYYLLYKDEKFDEWLGKKDYRFWLAACTGAVLNHHGGYLKKTSTKFEDKNLTFIMNGDKLEINLQSDVESMVREIVKVLDTDLMPFLFAVRMLRLADQKGTQQISTIKRYGE